jgi:arylsulfatase A-like enzyme
MRALNPTDCLVGWLLVGLVNAACLAFAMTVASPLTQWEVHVYAFGHCLAAGLVSWALMGAWERLVPKARPQWSYVTLGGCCSVVAWLALHEDLVSFSARMHEQGSVLPWMGIGVVAGAVSIPALVLLLRWLVRGDRIRGLLLLVFGAFIVIGHQRIRPGDYIGGHLFATWYGAIAMTIGVWAFHSAGWRPPKRLRLPLTAVCVTWASASLLQGPSDPARIHLLRHAGSFLAPYVARVWSEVDAPTPPEPRLVADPAWFLQRTEQPSIPPTEPPVAQRSALVLLLTIDSLRDDVLRDPQFEAAFPNLTQLRKRGVDFTQARSPSPGTIVTLTSIFTGKYYSQLYWTSIEGSRPLPWLDTSPRVPALLEAQGVSTLHILSDHGLESKVGGPGLGFGKRRRTERHWGPAAEAIDILLSELEHSEGPTFAYIHFMDAHVPYVAGGSDGPPFARYIRALATVDAQIGRLMDEVERRGLGARTVLIVSSDHGEAFGEHNRLAHSTSVYEELLRVPLVIAGPGISPTQVDTPVTLVDLGPTVLEMFGLPSPGDWMGQSLVPALVAKPLVPSRPIVADAGRRLQSIVFPDGIKAIVDLRRGTREQYDLNVDPLELRVISAPAHAQALTEFFAVHTLRRPGWSPPWRKN